MADQPKDLLTRGRQMAQEQILQSVRTRYFPEVWYALENWFQLLKGRRALEVGYGIGLVAEAMAKSGWTVTVVDPSVAALTELRERFAAGALNATFEQADADKLPFTNNSFDAIVAVNTLEFAVSPPEVAREIARVLSPGGRAVIATFNKLSPWGLPAVANAIRRDRGQVRARFMTKEEFVKILRAASLTVEDVKDRASYLPAGGLKLGLPISGAFVALVSKPADGGKGGNTEPKGKPGKNFILEK